jgi:MFS transporter, DHA1 family, tetracycline resistance protein
VDERAVEISRASSPNSGAAVAFIFLTILLDMLALGLIVPILPKLVESFVDNDTARAARIFGLFGTAWALMQFVFSPILGSLSDRFGRRPVVLLSNFGLGLDYVLMALAPSLVWLFIGRVISGITSASISTAFAYIADTTPPERRAAVFGKVGAAFGAGFVLGPAIGGLLGGLDPRLPFWAAAALSLVNALYGLLILPESLPQDRRSAFRWKSANPIGALQLLRSDRVLAGLSVVNFIAQLAHVALPSTFVLYASYRYGWDAVAVGLTLATVGICAMAVQGAGVEPIVTRLGERGALTLGLFDFRRGVKRASVLARHSRHVTMGSVRGGAAGAQHAIGCPGATRPVAGRHQQRAKSLSATRPLSVYADLCLLHRPGRAGEIAGRAIHARIRAAGARARDRPAYAFDRASALMPDSQNPAGYSVFERSGNRFA